jgi:triacylglycerol lipase
MAGLVLAGCGTAPAPGSARVVPGDRAVAQAAAERGAVLLIHGHRGDASSMAPLASWLAERGWKPKAISLVSDDWDMERLADQVAMHVEALSRESGESRIDVVGYSIGGIAARYYIKNHQGDRRIRRLVTLSSPHHGMGYATLGPWITVSRQLTPGAPFLTALNRTDETPGDVTYTCIWSTGDYTQLAPFGSGRLEGAFNVRTRHTPHERMASDPKLFPAVGDGLSVAPGAAPGPERILD